MSGLSEDEAVLRRARPFIAEALQRQEPDVGPALERAVVSGDLAVDFEHDEAGWLWLVFAAAGHPFCRIEARSVGLYEVAGELLYLRDEVLDDDVE
jgi:hypothetical protein